MEAENNYVIGFDLGKRYAQISYVSFEGDEGDLYNIPVCLCKRNGANQWFYGEEALKFAATGKGTLVRDLAELVKKGEPVPVDDREMDPADLLALFIRDSLSRMGAYEEGVGVKAMVLSVDELSPVMLEALKRVESAVMADFAGVYFEAKVESLFYYTIHQPKELWSYQVVVLDLSDGFLKLYRVEMNHKSRPILTTIEDSVEEDIVIPEEFPSIMEKDRYLEETDEKLYRLMEQFLEGQIVTSIYLIGKDFEKEWYPKTLKLLCRNRRVFRGSNLYSKGACLCGMEKIAPGETAKAYLYLGREKLKSDIGVVRMDQGKLVKEILIRGGANWFEAGAQFAFLPGEDYHLPIIIEPLDHSGGRVVPVVLPQIKGRDIKSMKFLCRLSMKSEKELRVEIEDAGMGAFYQSAGKRYEEIISLGGSL